MGAQCLQLQLPPGARPGQRLIVTVAASGTGEARDIEVEVPRGHTSGQPLQLPPLDLLLGECLGETERIEVQIPAEVFTDAETSFAFDVRRDGSTATEGTGLTPRSSPQTSPSLPTAEPSSPGQGERPVQRRVREQLAFEELISSLAGTRSASKLLAAGRERLVSAASRHAPLLGDVAETVAKQRREATSHELRDLLGEATAHTRVLQDLLRSCGS